MTRKESICMKCAYLEYADGVCTNGDIRSLISSCYFGGRNSGNRRTCKNFEKADNSMIEHRFKILEGD